MSQASSVRPAEAVNRPSLSTPGEDIRPVPDLVDYVKEYARQKPEVAALWCFGIGFVIGWKLKPW